MNTQNLTNYFTGGLGIRRWSFIKITFVMMAILLCGNLDTSAQKKRSTKKRNAKITRKKAVNNPKLKSMNSAIPVTVVNSAETDYLSGEASVVVNPKQPTIIRLGLSQNAVSIVEFPASDGVYYIHEGNPKLVSVFQSPTRVTDRSITVYPGEGFVASQNGNLDKNPSSTITLQMRSGLILILEFVPVSSVRKNAHRCVINYDREAVISARRTAGLAYDLGENIKPTKKLTTRANSKLIGLKADETILDEKTENETKKSEVRFASLDVNRSGISRRNKKSKQSPKTGLKLSRFVNKKLAESLKNPRKVLGDFSDKQNGLSMAVSKVAEIDAEQRLVIVAVKSHTTTNLRLIPGVPELQIQTADGKGNLLQTRRIERTYVESTSFEGLISPGSTAYYAVVFQAPIMGAKERLRVMVSHREAADTPNSVVLPKAQDAGGK